MNISGELGKTEQTGRSRLRGALLGGGLALLGTIIAWVVVGNLIR